MASKPLEECVPVPDEDVQPRRKVVMFLTFSIITFRDENNVQEQSGTFASVVYSNHESLCTSSETCTWLSG